jgi:anaerobic magnesium-protoporphyrin IX monomethyl ester cyclase
MPSDLCFTNPRMHRVISTASAVARVVILFPEVYDLARFKDGRKEFPPFGPLYLAAVAERAGHEVELQSVADGGRMLDLRRFDVVAFSISSSATYGVLLQARESALIRPDALLLAGGVHANFYPERTLRDFKVHAVGVGEGEMTFLECLARRREPHRLG